MDLRMHRELGNPAGIQYRLAIHCFDAIGLLMLAR